MKYTFNILPIIIKEFRQVWRDKRTLAVLCLMPSFLLIMVGYALNFDVKHIPLGFYYEDKSQTTNSFIEMFKSSEYFNVISEINNYREIDLLLDEDKILAVIVIPSDFSRNIHLGRNVNIQLIIDGSNANKAVNALNHIRAAIQNFSMKIMTEILTKQGVKISLPINPKPRLWYNPELKSSRYLIPGLFGMILMLVAVVSTSLSIVREKEQGSMEQIIVSPLEPYEIIIGKTIPYLIISLIATTFVVIMSVIIFNVQIEGNIFLFYLTTTLFLLGALGQGLLISTIANTQAIAFMVSILSSLLPTFLLSGFIFPIKNMPEWLQAITYIVPAKYYLFAVRSIMVKGLGISAFSEQLIYLSIFCIAILGISIIRMYRETAR